MLYLNGIEITDAGLVYLRGLTNLQELWLVGDPITDTGLVYLQGLASLKTLCLQGTKITDAGLSRLGGLSGLEVLDLSDTKVTDAGLVHLKGLTNLYSLNNRNTQITQAGLVQSGLDSQSLIDRRNRRYYAAIPIADVPSRRGAPVRIGAAQPAARQNEVKEGPFQVVMRFFAAVLAVIWLFVTGYIGMALLCGLGAAMPIILIVLFLKKR